MSPPDPKSADGTFTIVAPQATLSPPRGSVAEPVTALEHPTFPGTAVPTSPRADVYSGRTLDGRYLVDAILGEGGMGVVYRARHKVIGKTVAIKILRGDLAADREMTDRFLNEARAASSIGHPHIVDISDFGRLDDGSAYFVMEHLVGTSLGQLVANGRSVPVPRICRIVKQMARGLSAAHERGIVHRDLKPDNVMLVARGDDGDFVKILDFGIAKVGGEAARLTRAGSVFGTPHYMSPEQAAGVEVDARTDVYALGVMIYEMATGRVPFDADNMMGILTQHMYRSPPAMRSLPGLAQEVPEALDLIVSKCLEKRPELRYASMAELVADLERFERGVLLEAERDRAARAGAPSVSLDYFGHGKPTEAPSTRTKRPLRMAIFGAVGVAAAVAVVGGVALFRKSHAVSEAARDPSPSVARAASAPSAVPAARVSKQVVVTPDPPDAVVSVGPLRLGPGAQEVTVPPDGQVVVRVEHPAYKAAEVVVRGDRTLVPIKLEKESAAVAVVTALPSTRATAKASASVSPPSSPPPPPPVKPPATCPREERDPFTQECPVK